METMNSEPNPVVLVPGARTPFAKAFGELAGLSALDLSVHMVRSTLKRTGVKPDDVEAFIWVTSCIKSL
jgi:acetyl-CoA acetyltransferase